MSMSIKERIEFSKMKKDPKYRQLILLMLQHAAQNGRSEESVYRKIKEKENEQKGTE